MTMPYERTRALLWAGSFLIEIAQNNTLPVALRSRAVLIARHFPTIEDVEAMASTHVLPFLGPSLVHPDEVAWRHEGDPGPLTYNTHLSWPEEAAPRRSRGRKTSSATKDPADGKGSA